MFKLNSTRYRVKSLEQKYHLFVFFVFSGSSRGGGGPPLIPGPHHAGPPPDMGPHAPYSKRPRLTDRPELTQPLHIETAAPPSTQVHPPAPPGQEAKKVRNSGKLKICYGLFFKF